MPIVDYTGRRDGQEINLDEWKWLCKISGNDESAIEHYADLANRNEVLMVEIYNQYAYNIYTPIRTAPTDKKGKTE